MNRQTSLDDHVTEMRQFGQFLMPYNWPRVTPQDEEDIAWFKSRDIMVDGYYLIVNYSKSDYGEHHLESLQLLGKYSPFLPFCLVCKVAQRFLGSDHLGLVEIFRDGRKIYCWTLVTERDGGPVPAPAKLFPITFEGFAFSRLDPKEVNFY